MIDTKGNGRLVVIVQWSGTRRVHSVQTAAFEEFGGKAGSVFCLWTSV